MVEYLKKEIMEQSRHQFIYGYDNDERTSFLKSLEDDYPIVVGCNRPIAIYMKDYSLPVIEHSCDIDRFRLSQVNREYFNLILIKNIISRIKDNQSLLNDENTFKFLKQLYVVTSDRSSYDSFDSFDKDLDSSLAFYLSYYKDLLDGKDILPNINDVKIPFMMPDMIVPKIKKMLVNDSYFGIIIDKNMDYTLDTFKVINSYVSKRINGDLSMKVSCEPGKWKTYYDIVGEFIESTHDYGIVEFDDSYSKHTKELIKKYSI